MVGVNQRVIAPAALPFVAKQRLVMILSDEAAESDGRSFGPAPRGSVTIKVLDPKGSCTFSSTEKIDVPVKKRWKDLPLIVNIIVDIDVKIDFFGVYLVEATFAPEGPGEITRRFPLYAIDPTSTIDPGTESESVFSDHG
jgi:hypothetical protein